MISLSRPFFIQSYPSLRAPFLAVLMATGLLACTDTRTAVCLNGVRCPAGLMCVEPHGYCASPEDVEPCLGKPENVRCEYRGYDVGICRRGVCELDDCEDSVDCNDEEPCTRDTCVGERCVYEKLDGVSCTDGEFCNGADTCVAGECTGHSGNPCTNGQTYCDAELQACAGCTEHTDCPAGEYGPWSDCTGADGTCSRDGIETRTAITFTCDSQGICQVNESTETQTCMRNTDGVSCSDGSLCTTNDRCVDGVCGGETAPCNDGNQCTTDTCSPELGCRHMPLPFGAPCDHGSCDGMGGCVTCANVGQACDTDNPCERGEIRCQDGVMTCVPVGPAPATKVCRTAAGACDQPETCTGEDTVCPGDDFLQGTTCRAAAGACDVAETCTGTSAFCPSDTLRAPGFTCRATAGPCDVAETCTGSDPVCPVDGFLSPSITCRASAGVCDMAETCTGSSAACPGDSFVGPTFTCRPSAGICDTAETCTGSSATCPADVFLPPTTTCRAAAGGCDVTETCTGNSASCPGDTLRGPGFTCRAIAGPCDMAETCDGNTAACPADGFLDSSTTCRPVAPGGCDVAEACTGSSAACPADGFQDTNFPCRPAADVCDLGETCTGFDAVCPVDRFAGPLLTCRAATGTCDAPEVCTGAGPSCPSDAVDPPGEICRGQQNGCDVVEECDGTSKFCPLDDPGCGSDQYCFDTTCQDNPTFTFVGTEGPQCWNSGITHQPPAPFMYWEITGRAGAPFTLWSEHVSCPGSISFASEVDCMENGYGSFDDTIPMGGVCTVNWNNDAQTNCPHPMLGRWETQVEVDGVPSAIEVSYIYNNDGDPTNDCSVDDFPDSCAEAATFCPCTGACNAGYCDPPSRQCPPALDAGVASDDDTAFSPAEGAE
jgi:hypothetical protein